MFLVWSRRFWWWGNTDVGPVGSYVEIIVPRGAGVKKSGAIAIGGYGPGVPDHLQHKIRRAEGDPPYNADASATAS